MVNCYVRLLSHVSTFVNDMSLNLNFLELTLIYIAAYYCTFHSTSFNHWYVFY
jgi:hypothetical protein